MCHKVSSELLELSANTSTKGLGATSTAVSEGYKLPRSRV